MSAWYQPVRIVTERLIVREAAPREARRVARFLQENRRYHTPWEPTRSPEYFRSAVQRRILRTARREKRNLLLFLFTRDRPDAIVGSVTFSNIVRGAFRSCFLGYRIAHEYEGRGLMTEALASAIRYVFSYEGMHRIEANIMPANVRSIRLVQRLGFRCEGRAKRYLNIQGRWEDHDHYVLLIDEFDSIHKLVDKT